MKKTLKQFIYAAILLFSKITGVQAQVIKGSATPPVSFYTLEAKSIDGKSVSLSAYKGKYILVVNTASNCGYTGQYTPLEKLYEQYGNKLVVLGFPANDFKEQEKGSNAEIATFCKKNYGVTFPLFEKGVVIKTDAQQPVYKWLTDPAKNGWNKQIPTWNFSKYLISPTGELLGFFAPSIDPLSEEITSYLK
jgi:glutathione peroxidase